MSDFMQKNPFLMRPLSNSRLFFLNGKNSKNTANNRWLIEIYEAIST